MPDWVLCLLSCFYIEVFPFFPIHVLKKRFADCIPVVLNMVSVSPRFVFDIFGGVREAKENESKKSLQVVFIRFLKLETYIFYFPIMSTQQEEFELNLNLYHLFVEIQVINFRQMNNLIFVWGNSFPFLKKRLLFPNVCIYIKFRLMFREIIWSRQHIKKSAVWS